MRTTNGITATANYYTVTAVAVKDGTPVAKTFTADHRDARAAKQAAADLLHVPASRVAVEFELCKHTVVIDCAYETLIEALKSYGIGYEEK